MDRLLALFRIRQEEAGMVIKLFLYSSLIGFIRIYVGLPAQSIFLERYSAAELPYVYIFSGLITICIGAIYFRLGKWFSQVKLVMANLTFMAIVTLGLYFLLFLPAKWPAIVTYGWFLIVVILSSLAFWNITSVVMDVRQGKRLYALITAGEVVAFAIGGVAVNVLSKVLHPAEYMLFAFVSMLVGIWLALHLGKQFQEKFRMARAKPEAKAKSKKKKLRIRVGMFTVLLAAYFCSSEFMYYFVDNAFNDAIKQHATSTEAMVRILGNYAAIAAIAGFVTRSFIAGPLINRYGLIVPLLGYPFAILLGSVATFISGYMGLAVIMFWMMFTTRVNEKIFRGLQFSSLITLYKPLLNRASTTQNLVEGMAIPFAGTLSGAVLLVLHEVFHIGVTEIAGMLVGVCAIWIWVALRLEKQYVRLLPKTLNLQRVDEDVHMRILNDTYSEALSDEDMNTLIRRELQSDRPYRVIHALDYMERIQDDVLYRCLLPLLVYPDNHIRLEVLNRIEKHRYASAYDALEIMLSRETDWMMKMTLVRVMCVIDQPGIKLGINLLDSEDSAKAFGAMVGLLRSGRLEGIVYAGGQLIAKLGSMQPEDRIYVAKVLEAAQISGFYYPIEKLLIDPHEKVRLEAIKASRAFKNPILIPSLIENLNYHNLRSAVVSTFLAYGDQAMDCIRQATDVFYQSPQVLQMLIRTAGLARGDRAIRYLLDKLNVTNLEIRHEVILALKAAGFQAREEDIPFWHQQITTEMQHITKCAKACVAFNREAQAELLNNALKFEITLCRERIFLMLSFIYNRKRIMQAWYNYSLKNSEKLSYALEMLETLLPRDFRIKLFVYLEEISHEELIRRSKLTGFRRIGLEQQLKKLLLSRRNELLTWTRCCAVNLAEKMNASLYVEELLVCLQSKRTQVAHLAYRALLPLYKQHSTWRDQILQEMPPKYVDLLKAGQYINKVSLIDKMQILQSFEFFQDIEFAELAGILQNVQDKDFPAGTVIYQEGQIDQAMYLILRGIVQIEEKGQVKLELSQGQTFGESTVFINESHNSTAVAITDVSVYCLYQETLYNVLTINADVSRKMANNVVNTLRGKYDR